MARPNRKQKILEILSGGGFVSGESLAGELGITRPAVWKHVHQLKKEGFTIESLQGRGYRLKAVPDILFPDLIRREIDTGYWGKEIHHFIRTDSTNIQARILAAEGAADGTLVVAEYQEKGRGRLQRNWASPLSQNLLFSILLRPPWPPHQAFYGTALAAVCLCQSIAEVAGLAAGIKWPNDIYTGNKKLAGILTEFATDPDRLEHLIIGIGLNCHWAPKETAPGAQAATCIRAETGQKISRLRLLARFLHHGETLYEKAKAEGIGLLRKEWNRYSLTNNRRVKMVTHQRTWSGLAQGIDDNGALILLLDNGRKETFHTGDVHLRF